MSTHNAFRLGNLRIASREAWPLAWRLLFPLVVLAAIFSGAVTFLLIQLVSVRMDRDSDSRLEALAGALATGGLALDHDLLSRVRTVAAAEVTTVSLEGRIIASSLPEESARALAEEIRKDHARRRVTLAGERYRVVTRTASFPGRSGAFMLIIAASTNSTDLMKRGLAWTIVVAAGAQLLLLLTIVHVVVKTAARPLARLASAARDVGQGALDRRVPGGGGREIDTLAREFNVMVEELARSRQELVRAERLAVAGRMAASVAHEIRNPLSVIRMNIQLLARRPHGLADHKLELQDVLDEVDRMDLVVGNLLDLTVPSRFNPEPVKLNTVVEDTLRLTSQKMEHLNVKVRTDLQEDLPEIALDVHKARQAFLNVILNAADAMPGGGTLGVRTRRLEDAVELSFEDTGVGISPTLAEKAFEPFFTTKHGGAGLGLHIVRSIMEVHDARVRLEPASPRGARCVMEFPAVMATARPAEPAVLRRPA